MDGWSVEFELRLHLGGPSNLDAWSAEFIFLNCSKLILLNNHDMCKLLQATAWNPCAVPVLQFLTGFAVCCVELRSGRDTVVFMHTFLADYHDYPGIHAHIQ
jgi:hypothetical protein